MSLFVLHHHWKRLASGGNMTHLKRTLAIAALTSLRYPAWLALGVAAAWLFDKIITNGWLPGAI
jgi:hypothetical protein